MAETREQYLARVARVHDEWVDKYIDSTPFRPDGPHGDAEDYNEWYVDLEASPEAMAELMRRTAPPAEGFAPSAEEPDQDELAVEATIRDTASKLRRGVITVDEAEEALTGVRRTVRQRTENGDREVPGVNDLSHLTAVVDAGVITHEEFARIAVATTK